MSSAAAGGSGGAGTGNRRSARRAGWGVADQALSSLTNFALAVVLARRLTPDEFGAASVAFAIYLLCLTVARALTSEPFTVRHSGLSHEQWRPAAAEAVGSALTIGVAAGLLLAVVGLLIGGLVGAALVALAVAMPGLLVQDAWRFTFFAAGRPRDAFLNDLAWAVLLVPALVLAAPSTEPWAYILAWGLAGGLAGLFGVAQARLLPAPRRIRSWLGANRQLAWRYAVEALVLTGAAQLRLVVVAAIGGLAMAGALRAGQVILGAIHPLTYGVQMGIVPEAVSTARRSRGDLTRLVVRLSLGLALMSALWGVVVWLLPSEIGSALFGSTWSEARSTIPGQTIVIVASGVITGALVGLRSLGAASRSLWARVVGSSLAFVGAVAGAASGDAGWCAMAIGIGVALSVPVWWRAYRQALGDPATGIAGTRSAAGGPDGSTADPTPAGVEPIGPA